MGVLLKMRSIFSPHHFWGTGNMNLNMKLNMNLKQKLAILTWMLTRWPHKPTEKLGDNQNGLSFFLISNGFIYKNQANKLSAKKYLLAQIWLYVHELTSKILILHVKNILIYVLTLHDININYRITTLYRVFCTWIN